MIPMTLQPVFHMFNSFLPSITAFLVISAIVMGLPVNSSKNGKRQPARVSNGMKLQRASFNRPRQKQPSTVGVKMYTIPTSMRIRNSRDY